MIDILPTAEQLEFVSAVAKALAKTPRDAGSGPDLPWALIAELGCIGMGLHESIGGAGFSVADEALMHQELGRQLVSPNVLAAALAAWLAAEAGDDELAQQIHYGVRRVAFVSPLGGTASAAGLVGEFHLLTEAEDDLVFYLSHSGCGIAEAASFADRKAALSTDEAFELVRASGPAPFVHWRADDDHRLWLRASLLIAAELTGIADATLHRAVDYAKLREQFGKPIGAFQAVAHHCADMALCADAATSQLYFAAIAQRDETPEAALQVAAACVCAMGAAFHNATMAIQVHGAIGYSAESGLHRFLKRAILLRHLAGGERTQELAVFHAKHDA